MLLSHKSWDEQESDLVREGKGLERTHVYIALRSGYEKVMKQGPRKGSARLCLLV